jgi:hypothetical protein
MRLIINKNCIKKLRKEIKIYEKLTSMNKKNKTYIKKIKI